MTNSPPAKVKNEPCEDYKVLASGIDSLVLAIDVQWSEDNIFSEFAELKDKAKLNEKPETGILKAEKINAEWPFHMQPFGSGGYEWLLVGNEFNFRIGNWLKPKSRPSVMVEIRSETLWRLGVKSTLAAIRSLLRGAGALTTLMKPSRVDLCVDMLLPAELWETELLDLSVTRATGEATYKSRKKLSGFAIGKGKMAARLYDKPLEIREKSKKFWMFDIWKLKRTPKDKKIIRTEFQIRRETLKELEIETIEHLLKHQHNVWAYCTQNWFKFRDNPGKHHTQRKTLEFWKVVQNGFEGAQGAEPLIRQKAFNTKKEQVMRQAYGLLTTLTALRHEELELSMDSPANIADCTEAMFDALGVISGNEKTFAEDVRQKRAVHHRSAEKAKDAFKQRRERGFPRSIDYTKNQDANLIFKNGE